MQTYCSHKNYEKEILLGKGEEKMDKIKPLYQWSRHEADSCRETDLWVESHKENIRCARAIETAINRNFDGKSLNTDCAGSVIREFGYNRVMWVLAATLQEKQSDGRFSHDNKKWGGGFYIPKDTPKREFCVESHPAVLDGFIDQTRRAWKALNLFDSSHCCTDSDGMDYTNKVVVIDSFCLKDEYKTPDDQLFFADRGFGCSPTAVGKKVFGYFLKDGERTHYQRSDIIGVLSGEHLPEWAREKLQEVPEAEEIPHKDITMGGM